MAKKLLPVNELLRLACIYAYNDQEEHLRCIADTGDTAEIEKTKAFMAQLRAYRMRRRGQTKLEAAMAELVPASMKILMSRTVSGCIHGTVVKRKRRKS